jgi:hypothetical protein
MAMDFVRSEIRITYMVTAAIIALALTVCGCVVPQAANKSARAIKPEEVAGTWGGLSDDSVFHLLKLKEGGIGLFGYLHRGGQPAVLRIKNWRCENKRILVLLEPDAENPDGIIELEGPAGWTSMNLAVTSPTGGQRRVVFHREDMRAEMRNVLESRMAEEETAGGRNSKN